MNPELIIKTFSLPILSATVYKGKVKGVIPDKSKVKRLSKIGTQVFSDLQFSPADVFGTGELIDHIPIDCALFTVIQEKNIVETEVAGRNGSIKEFIGMKDYEINIKGVIASNLPGVAPTEHVENLIAFLEYQQSLGINSSFLNDIFGVMEVVIISYTCPQVEGGISQQEFEIRCKADRPVEILISDAD
ncbi:MAG: hypothetical protein BWY74_04565 [Firmicutes bacterium ADurb.Bin419]|nr:MAG: hypothetical protein BWY74_04565 [Firmicutes bacterium ADurb.Bin419]